MIVIKLDITIFERSSKFVFNIYQFWKFFYDKRWQWSFITEVTRCAIKKKGLWELFFPTRVCIDELHFGHLI